MSTITTIQSYPQNKGSHMEYQTTDDGASHRQPGSVQEQREAGELKHGSNPESSDSKTENFNRRLTNNVIGLKEERAPSLRYG